MREENSHFAGRRSRHEEKQPSLFDATEDEGAEANLFTYSDGTVEDDAAAGAVNAEIDNYMEAFGAFLGDYAAVEEDADLTDEQRAARFEELEDAIFDRRDAVINLVAAYYSERGVAAADARLQSRDLISGVQAQVSAELGGKAMIRFAAENQRAATNRAAATAAYHTLGGDVVSYSHDDSLDRLEDGEFCLVERRFVEDRQFAFSGSAKVESADDVAYIFRQLENSAVENTFVAFVKDGKPYVVHVGMGSAVASMVDGIAVRGAWDALGGADAVYFVHNHPSGNVKASAQDRDLLKAVEAMFPGAKVGGVIIDTRSGKYGTFGNMAVDGTATRPAAPRGEEVPVKVSQFSGYEFSADFNPDNLTQIANSGDIAKFVSTQRLGARGKVGALILSQQNGIVANFHLPFADVSDTDAVAETIARLCTRYGGVRAVLYGNYPNRRDEVGPLSAAVRRKTNGAVAVLDSVTVNNGIRESAFDNGMIGEASLPYSDARSESGNSFNGENARERARASMQLDSEEAMALVSKMEVSAVDDPKIELTPKSWYNSFGLSNSIDTPLGKVKMGESQYQKLVDKKRSAEFGMVVQTLQDPDVVFIEPSEAKEGQPAERNFSYVFVKTFIRDGKKFKYYTSVSVMKDGMEVSVSSHIASKTAIMKKLQNMERAYTKVSLLPNSSEWHLAEHPTDVPDLLPTQGKSELSGRKDSDSSQEKQEAEGESSESDDEWLKWIQDGKTIRIDQKEKVQAIIDSLRTNPAESERIGLNLVSAAKVVNNFENPKIDQEDDVLLRSGRKYADAREEYDDAVRTITERNKVTDEVRGQRIRILVVAEPWRRRYTPGRIGLAAERPVRS